MDPTELEDDVAVVVPVEDEDEDEDEVPATFRSPTAANVPSWYITTLGDGPNAGPHDDVVVTVINVLDLAVGDRGLSANAHTGSAMTVGKVRVVAPVAVVLVPAPTVQRPPHSVASGQQSMSGDRARLRVGSTARSHLFSRMTPANSQQSKRL